LLNFTITSLERTEVKVHMVGTHGKENFDQNFDYVFWAAPIHGNFDILKFSQADEKLFKRQVHFLMRTTLFQIPENPEKFNYGVCFWPGRLNTKVQQGQVFALRCSKKEFDEKNPNDTFVAYQFVDQDESANFKEEKFTELFDEFVKKYELPTPKILLQHTYPYFYHWDREDIKNGVPWLVEGIQGKNRTFIIGSTPSFESVLGVVGFNNGLLLRHCK